MFLTVCIRNIQIFVALLSWTSLLLLTTLGVTGYAAALWLRCICCRRSSSPASSYSLPFTITSRVADEQYHHDISMTSTSEYGLNWSWRSMIGWWPVSSTASCRS